MAKKKETGASSSVLNALKKCGYFRKISDRVQVGIPDIIGCYQHRFHGVEVKAISEVPADGLVPPKGSHPFDTVQIMNLKDIDSNGGLGAGVVVCGRKAVWCYWHQINKNGQVNWYKLWEEAQAIEDINDFSKALEVW